MTTIIGLLGYALIPVGVAMVSVPLAVICAGVELVYIAYANQPEPTK